METYRVQQFDPRTGTYTELPNDTGNGTVALTTPDRQDWIYVLTKVSENAQLAADGAQIVGDGSNNTPDGGMGNPTLTGGGGSHRFRYNTSTQGSDTIADFDDNDRLEISAAGFGGGLVAGIPLSEGVKSDRGFFVNGSTPIGKSANFLYNSGTLSFDVDGIGSQAAVKIASFLAKVTLSSAQFLIGV